MKKTPSYTLTLKVSRREAGKVFPWDKVYIVPDEDALLVGKGFPYALMFPLTKRVADLLREVTLTEVRITGAGRSEVRESIRGSGGSEYGAADIAKAAEKVEGLSGPAHLMATLCEHLSRPGGPEGWSVVVPTFPEYRRGMKPTLGAKYLLNRRWVRNHSPAVLDEPQKRLVPYSTDVQTFPASTALLSQGKVIRPACAACTNLLRHLGGECSLGGFSCYEGIRFGNNSNFRRGLMIHELVSDGVPLSEAYQRWQAEESSGGL